VTRRPGRFFFCALRKQQRKENIMDHDDILHLEALEFMRNASDELLQLATLQEIDLNTLAHHELRSRRRPIGSAYIRNLSREFQP
jgi:hypothetical protein